MVARKRESEPQDMRVEAGRQMGCWIGRNQSRPCDSRRQTQIDIEASPIARKGAHDIGHHHYQGGALRRLLIHAIENPEERDHEKAAADPEQPAKQPGYPTEAHRSRDA